MRDPIGIRRGIRNTRRAAEVITVLARHGFRQLLADTGIERIIGRGQELLLRTRNDTVVSQPIEVRFRQALEELGGTFIKLGQVLSTRPDLVPQEFSDELRRLRADCPRVPWPAIAECLQHEFGARLQTLFAHIDEEPLAAASIAQVHAARLADGTPIVLKILRPGIEELIAADMDILSEIAALLETRFQELGYSPVETVREFQRELQREVDMQHEGRSTDQLRRLFSDQADVSFPIVYWDASTRRVLALEHVQGTLLSRLDPATLSPERRRTIVASGARAVFRQCLEFGLFHADPHPGNIFVRPDDTLCFIDCGMTGRIDQQTMQDLAMLVLSVINSDLEGVLDAVSALCQPDPVIRLDRSFRRDAADFMARFERGTMASLDMAGLLNELFSLLKRYRLRCPADLVFLIKALSTIQGVAREIDPGFDLIAHGRPQLEKLIRDRCSLSAVAGRLKSAAWRYVSLAEDLPDEVRDVMDQLRRREFSVNLRHHGIDRLNDNTIEHASGTIAVGLVITGLLIASSVLILAESRVPEPGFLRTAGIAGLTVAVTLALLLPIRWMRRRKK